MARGKRFRTVVVMVVAVGVLAATPFAFAQQSGDSVTFLIPADSNQPEPPSGPNDKLIYTGGRVTTIDITGCGTGAHPVQNAVLVDLAGGRSGRIIGVITSSEVDAVHPGTQIKALSANGSCSIGGTTYNRYLGTVE